MYSILIAAGWPVWPLLLTSIVALAILIERIWFLQAKRIAPPHLVDGAIQLADSGALKNSQSAQQATDTLASAAPLGTILSAALLAKAHILLFVFVVRRLVVCYALINMLVCAFLCVACGLVRICCSLLLVVCWVV
ncbi:MAG: hypothetical protein ACKN8Y_01135, partial [Polynucleobacter victoriensis]